MRLSLCVICLLMVGILVPAGAVQALDVDAIRQAIEQSGAQWTAGQTPMSGLSPEELSAFASTPRPVIEHGAELWTADRCLAELPDHFDWRDFEGENWVTDIRDQGLCAGCSAFAAIGAFEVLVRYYDLEDPNGDIDLSEQHLFSCSGGTCAGGMLMGVAMLYLKAEGVPDEECFPYQSGDAGEDFPCGDTCEDWEERARRIESWKWVNTSSRDNIMQALLEGPLYTFIQTYEDFYTYTDGIYEHTTGGAAGGHGVTLIGYDVPEEYWIGKNSWGEEWGEDGFFRIKWGDSEIETYLGKMEYDPPGDDDDDDDDDDTGDDDDDTDDDDDDDDTDDTQDEDDDDDDSGCSG